jgi:hypothetical protein
MLVVMAGTDAKHVLQLAAAEDEQAIEALATHAADPAPGVGVRVRRPDGCADHRNPFASQDLIEAAAEVRVDGHCPRGELRVDAPGSDR